MFDIIIAGGKIIDGTGEKEYIADIGIKDGIITFIGNLDGKESSEIIKATGRVVTPGFIDMHSHGDITLPRYPGMESALLQGITTILGGNCGLSIAPCDEWWTAQWFEYEQLEELSGNNLSTPDVVKTQDISPLMKRDYGFDICWRSFEEYLEYINALGIGGNYIPMVGHGAIRAQVLGLDYKRAANNLEIEQMKEHLRDAMLAGAVGLSTGLDYAPGIYADFQELKALCGVVAECGGIYDPHWRKTGLREGPTKKQKKIDGIIEALELGLQTGAQVHLAHLSCGFEVYPGGDSYMEAASARRTLQIIDEYRKKGVKVTYDVIPNVTAGLELEADFCLRFLPWLKNCGSCEVFAEKLKTSDYRLLIAKEINSGNYYPINAANNPDWAAAYTILQHNNAEYVGCNLAKLAERKKQNPLETAFDLLAEDPYTKTFMVIHGMTTASIREFISDPNATIGTDSFVFDENGIISVGKGLPPYYPSPNTFSGMIKYLCEFAQKSFAETIKKITGKSAEILRLKDRGIIAEGKKADIVVLNNETLATNENHIDPRVWPTGIEYVLVNGKIAVQDGKYTGTRSGTVVTM